jgi:mannose-6-phosphate isomerase-like protein (cupin superfamily)
MTREAMLARHRTAAQIRESGAIGNLNDGPVIRLHGVETRLIAWPGNGFQTESVHVLSLAEGESSSSYTYACAEEAMICVAGQGEVLLHGRWVAFAPGDCAYFPEGVERAVRQAGGPDTLVCVAQITPPQFELYAEAGFYQTSMGVMNLEGCFRAGLNARSGGLAAPLDLRFRETDPAVRSWNLPAAEVRASGALFNIFMGAPFDALGIPARLVLWPGAGTRTAGFNFACADGSVPDFIHTHPVSDECLILWQGRGRGLVGADSGWIELNPLDCLLAPCGVLHGHCGIEGVSHWGGFASPPQVDLLVKTPYYSPDGFSPGTSLPLE